MSGALDRLLLGARDGPSSLFPMPLAPQFHGASDAAAPVEDIRESTGSTRSRAAPPASRSSPAPVREPGIQRPLAQSVRPAQASPGFPSTAASPVVSRRAPPSGDLLAQSAPLPVPDRASPPGDPVARSAPFPALDRASSTGESLVQSAPFPVPDHASLAGEGFTNTAEPDGVAHTDVPAFVRSAGIAADTASHVEAQAPPLALGEGGDASVTRPASSMHSTSRARGVPAWEPMRPASDGLPPATAAQAYKPDGRDVFDDRDDRETPAGYAARAPADGAQVPSSAEPDPAHAQERTIARERSLELARERQQERVTARERNSTAATALRGGDIDRRGMAQSPPAPLAPAIHVTIGRVDVQAAQAPQPARPRAPAPQQPKLSLDDYLKRRGRRAP
jgi:hypothetical protein